MLYHYGSILGSAKKALERSYSDTTEASVAIMMSAMALECYINDFTQRVTHHNSICEDNEIIAKLSFFLNEYENNNNSLKSKIDLIFYILNGEKTDKGSRLYQDLDMLLQLRNSYVHRKPESTGKNGLEVEKPHKYVRFFVERKLIENPPEKYPPIWSYALNSPKVAQWALNTVKAVINNITASLPEESMSKQVETLLVETLEKI
ncbi:hypothetical protein AB0539_004711 [Vibrio parahaemolyticus]|uniref:hypothetical protein n=1 Tax=Vibrio parahaemolyticus TaxID=670 RepID=UPI00248AC693|nr:hypothetical protein [Vibrio parahaemolyticus]